MSVNGDKVTEDGRILTDRRARKFVMFALDPTVVFIRSHRRVQWGIAKLIRN